jgi:predicted ATPase
MAIDKLLIGNFKGIADPQWIDIKPLTVFIGGNSSGKSTCIHALACLSQTVKVTNNTRPLILDDEFASVHLGRFIEVIHSKSYQDVISLGVELSSIPIVGASGFSV